MTLASTNELLAYLADLVEELERYAFADAFDAFRRLYDTWLTDQTPDCLALTCLG